MVILIISLLVSLTLPTLTAVQHRVNRIRCVHGLRQTILWQQLYMTDDTDAFSLRPDEVAKFQCPLGDWKSRWVRKDTYYTEDSTNRHPGRNRAWSHGGVEWLNTPIDK